jgi:geranylgeranyl pyrophosphate synthase
MISTTATDLQRCPFSQRVEAIWRELRLQLCLSPVSSSAWGTVEDVVPDSKNCLHGLLVMLAGEVADALQEELLPAATAMELLNRAMNGMQQAGAAFQSVLVGEVLYTRGLSLVARMHSEAVQVFADLAEHLVSEKWKVRESGQLLKTTEQEYFEHAYAKSAIVLANCCKMGALLGSCPSEVVEAMTSYGYSLGMALQISQDLQVLMERIGGGDRISFAKWDQGTLPLPLIHSLQESQHTRLLLSSTEVRAQSVACLALLRCLRETKSIRYTHEVVESYAKKAKASLSVLPASMIKTLLVDLVDLVVE